MLCPPMDLIPLPEIDLCIMPNDPENPVLIYSGYLRKESAAREAMRRKVQQLRRQRELSSGKNAGETPDDGQDFIRL